MIEVTEEEYERIKNNDFGNIDKVSLAQLAASLLRRTPNENIKYYFDHNHVDECMNPRIMATPRKSITEGVIVSDDIKLTYKIEN